MKNRLPVYLDNLELPKDNFKKEKRNNSSGHISVLTLLSIMTTIASLITILIYKR